jgi:hypothetical protein
LLGELQDPWAQELRGIHATLGSWDDVIVWGHEPALQAGCPTATAETTAQDEVAGTRRAEADRALLEAVVDARQHHVSWAAIGSLLGTSGEAARQRYGDLVKR